MRCFNADLAAHQKICQTTKIHREPDRNTFDRQQHNAVLFEKISKQQSGGDDSIVEKPKKKDKKKKAKKVKKEKKKKHSSIAIDEDSDNKDEDARIIAEKLAEEKRLEAEIKRLDEEEEARRQIEEKARRQKEEEERQEALRKAEEIKRLQEEKEAEAKRRREKQEAERLLAEEEAERKLKVAAPIELDPEERASAESIALSRAEQNAKKSYHWEPEWVKKKRLAGKTGQRTVTPDQGDPGLGSGRSGVDLSKIEGREKKQYGWQKPEWARSRKLQSSSGGMEDATQEDDPSPCESNVGKETKSAESESGSLSSHTDTIQEMDASVVTTLEDKSRCSSQSKVLPISSIRQSPVKSPRRETQCLGAIGKTPPLPKPDAESVPAWCAGVKLRKTQNGETLRKGTDIRRPVDHK